MKKFKAVYNSGDGIVEIVVRDETGAKLEHFRMNWRDSKKHREVAVRLKNKYGIELTGKEEFFEF